VGPPFFDGRAGREEKNKKNKNKTIEEKGKVGKKNHTLRKKREKDFF